MSAALAALLVRAEGAEVWEDELLGRLRGEGLITYPSPLLGRLLERLPEVLAAEVLPRLPPTDLAMVARVGPASRAAVMSSVLLSAGLNVGLPFKLEEFVRSAERLAWARANDCPWVAATCALAAAGGRLDVLRWAREHGCDWDAATCAGAAYNGHMAVLMWAREHGCPWAEGEEGEEEDAYTMNCCALAGRAPGGVDVASSARLPVE